MGVKPAKSLVYIYIYILCLSVGLLYPINLKTAEPIGLKFCVGPYKTPEKVYGCSKLKRLCPEVLDFCKILKMSKTNIMKSTNAHR